MAGVEKGALKTNQDRFVIYLRSWLSNHILKIKAISVALLGLVLIILVRIICSFMGRVEAPGIDLNEIE